MIQFYYERESIVANRFNLIEIIVEDYADTIN